MDYPLSIDLCSDTPSSAQQTVCQAVLDAVLEETDKACQTQRDPQACINNYGTKSTQGSAVPPPSLRLSWFLQPSDHPSPHLSLEAKAKALKKSFTLNREVIEKVAGLLDGISGISVLRENYVGMNLYEEFSFENAEYYYQLIFKKVFITCLKVLESFNLENIEKLDAPSLLSFFRLMANAQASANNAGKLQNPALLQKYEKLKARALPLAVRRLESLIGQTQTLVKENWPEAQRKTETLTGIFFPGEHPDRIGHRPICAPD